MLRTDAPVTLEVQVLNPFVLTCLSLEVTSSKKLKPCAHKFYIYSQRQQCFSHKHKHCARWCSRAPAVHSWVVLYAREIQPRDQRCSGSGGVSPRAPAVQSAPECFWAQADFAEQQPLYWRNHPSIFRASNMPSHSRVWPSHTSIYPPTKLSPRNIRRLLHQLLSRYA